MATSSITVVSNANRLRRVDIRPSYEQETQKNAASHQLVSTATD